MSKACRKVHLVLRQCRTLIIITLPLCPHPPPLLPGLKASPRMQEPGGLSFTDSWTQSARHLLFPKPSSSTVFISLPRSWSQNIWSHPLFWKNGTTHHLTQCPQKSQISSWGWGKNTFSDPKIYSP